MFLGKSAKIRLLHQYNSLNSIASYPSTTTNDTCSRQLVRSSFLATGPTQGMFYIYRILSEFRIFRLIILRNTYDKKQQHFCRGLLYLMSLFVSKKNIISFGLK